MRKILLLLFIGLLSPCIHAQKIHAQKIHASKVPSIVVKNFKGKFPSAQKVKWREKESLYFAQFTLNKKGIDVTYQGDGTWVETLTEIDIKDLPPEVVTGIYNLFTVAKIKSAAKIEQASKETLYIVFLKYKGGKAEITLDSKGNQVEET